MFKVFHEELTSDWRVVKHNYQKFGGKVLGKHSRTDQPALSSLETMSTFHNAVDGKSKENVPLPSHFIDTSFHPLVADKRDKKDRVPNNVYDFCSSTSYYPIYRNKTGRMCLRAIE